MDQQNDKLKSELLNLISTMERQLEKVTQRRQQRLTAERARKDDNQDQYKKTKKGALKLKTLQ